MTIKLPLKAMDLVDAAKEQHRQESREVEKQMLEVILPRTIKVLFKYDEDCQAMAKRYSNLESEDFEREVSQNLWSYPGTSGVSRIRAELRILGLSEEDSDTVAQAILNYTRYPMSIVNYMRHVRSSINGIGNVFYGPKAPDSVLQDLGYSKAKLSGWVASSNSLNTARINDEKDFYKWLEAVELHMRQFMPMQMHINHVLSGRTTAADRSTPNQMMLALPRAYARRFGNYVASHAKFDSTDNSTRGLGSTVSDEFAKLLELYSRPDKDIYQALVKDFQRRANRISAVATGPIQRSNRRSSVFEKFIEQSLNINGKKVEIRTSSSKLSSELVNKFMKSLLLQFDLNPDQKVLSTRLNIGNEAIEVEVEKPAKSDLKKIQSFIESMYLD